MIGDSYGKEIILDLHNCDSSKFTRKHIERYLKSLCRQIKMKREDLYFWDYDDPREKAIAPAHLKGTSAVQFILTSTIVIHTLDELKQIYINVFSCKDFNTSKVKDYTKKFFSGKIVNVTVVRRK